MRFVLLLALSFTAIALAATPRTTHPVGANGFKSVMKAKRPLRILLSNDDSWASANVRATYYALRTAGHNVLLVGPAMNQSGKGGTVVLPTNKTLTSPGRDNSIPVGAPFSGRNESDDGINYFDGTPAASVLWAIDNVAPNFFHGQEPDLTVTGPNEGTNLGSFLYTLSGTIGASYVSVERGIPAIAFSASTEMRDYKTLDFESPTDESNVIATYTANLVTILGDSHEKRILPLGLGGTVNYAANVGSRRNCSNAKWYHSRLTGGAYIDKIIIDDDGMPNYKNIVAPGLNRCLSGDCSLPGEQDTINKDKCAATVSIYSVDYDAPTSAQKTVKPHVDQAVSKLNGRKH